MIDIIDIDTLRPEEAWKQLGRGICDACGGTAVYDPSERVAGLGLLARVARYARRPYQFRELARAGFPHCICTACIEDMDRRRWLNLIVRVAIRTSKVLS